MSSIQFLLLVLVAAVAGMGSVLDECQFHRPLVACTLVGLVLGDMTTGIILGGTLEMLALGWMNVGAAMAPDAALASVISAILVIVGHQSIGAGIAIAVPLAAAGQVLTIFVRTITVFFQHLADKFALQGNGFGIEMCHIGGLLLQGIRVAVPAALVAAIAGTNMMNAKALMPFFFLGFLIAVFTNVNLIGFGAIGLICAYFHIKGLQRDLAAQEAAASGAGHTGDALDDIDDSDLM